MLVFEWEGFGLESFWNYTSLSLSVYIYRERHVLQLPVERLLAGDDVAESQPQIRPEMRTVIFYK